MSKKVLVPIADGTEEMEAVAIIDILRRAGAEVTVASVDDLRITTARGLKIEADCLLADCRDETFDLIALPGGIPGAEHLRDSEILTGLLKKQKEEGRLLGAICASPVVVLNHHGLLAGLKATSYPTFSGQLENREAVEEKVVVDNRIVTSRGVGTALDFSLALVALLFGQDKSDEVARTIVYGSC